MIKRVIDLVDDVIASEDTIAMLKAGIRDGASGESTESWKERIRDEKESIERKIKLIETLKGLCK